VSARIGLRTSIPRRNKSASRWRLTRRDQLLRGTTKAGTRRQRMPSDRHKMHAEGGQDSIAVGKGPERTGTDQRDWGAERSQCPDETGAVSLRRSRSDGLTAMAVCPSQSLSLIGESSPSRLRLLLGGRWEWASRWDAACGRARWAWACQRRCAMFVTSGVVNVSGTEWS
jgi:hypothetical protein